MNQLSFAEVETSMERHERHRAIKRRVMEQEGRAGFARLADMACERCAGRCLHSDPFESDCPAATDLLESYGAAPHLKPQARDILHVLSDMRPHSMTEFVDGEHGFTVLAGRATCRRDQGGRLPRAQRQGRRRRRDLPAGALMKAADGFVPHPALSLAFGIVAALEQAGVLAADEGDALLAVATCLLLAEREGLVSIPEVLS